MKIMPVEDEKQPWDVRSRARTFVAANKAVTATKENIDFIVKCLMAVASGWL